MAEVAQCSNCRFSWISDGLLECRVNPPTVIPVAPTQGWPLVRKEDWCGKHERVRAAGSGPLLVQTPAGVWEGHQVETMSVRELIPIIVYDMHLDFGAQYELKFSASDEVDALFDSSLLGDWSSAVDAAGTMRLVLEPRK